MGWEFSGNKPIYAEIVDRISMDIIAGVYTPGQRLPSVRDLAMEAGVNPNTMQRALAELERMDMVHSIRTSGRFVTEDASVTKEFRSKVMGRYVEEFFKKLYRIGLTDAEIDAAIREWREKRGGQA